MRDKILTETEVAYPVFTVNTTYHYRKVGTPTVFDELLMDLAAGFPQLKKNSLAQILDLFALDEVFIRHTLQYLEETGLIENRYFDDISLEDIELSDLALTPLGQQFYRAKRMPGKRRITQQSFYFNPLTQKYTEKPKRNDISNIKLAEELFDIQDETLQVLSMEEYIKLSWYEPDVHLEDNGIEHESVESYWQAVKIKLVLDHNNNVRLHCDDLDFNQWLETRSAQVKREYFLEPILKEAKKGLHSDTILNFAENELHSFVLSDQKSDLLATKNSIAVKFSTDKVIGNSNKPYIELSNQQNEASLMGKVLFIPSCDNFPDDNITQLFFEPNSQKIFVEKEGIYQAYFDHQYVELPIKIVTESANNWIQNLPVFKRPNLDTLVFMANYLLENEIVAKLPILSIEKATEFRAKITKIWGDKTFSPTSWAEKIELLQSEQDLVAFENLFPTVPLTLGLFDSKMHAVLLDKAIKDPNSKVAKLSTFSDLLKAMLPLAKLDSEKLALNLINQDTLSNLAGWKKISTEFNCTYPQAGQSPEFLKMSENLTTWENKVAHLFKPLEHGKKFAVIDTNFIRQQPHKLDAIKAERTVILPKVVLDELDHQKEALKRAIDEESGKLNKMDVRPLLDQIGTLTVQIKERYDEITALDDRLKKKQAALKAMEIK